MKEVKKIPQEIKFLGAFFN